MRLRRVEGSATVLVFAAIPLLTAILLLVVDIGRIAVSRARLQAAADRAAYAAAAYLAEGLNAASTSNWKLHKAFRDLRDDFEASSYDGEDAAKERIDIYESERDASLYEMEAALDGLEPGAVHQAETTLAANSPDADLDLFVDADLSLEEVREVVRYDYVNGFGLSEPESSEGGEYEALSHLVKEQAPSASVGIFATAEVSPLLLGVLSQDPVEVHAASAAQAYGGSMEEFALKEVDSLDEAESLVDDEGYDALYRSSIVPTWSSGMDASGINY